MTIWAEIRFKNKTHGTESSKITGLNTHSIPHASPESQTFWFYMNKSALETPGNTQVLHCAVLLAGWHKDRKPQTQDTAEEIKAVCECFYARWQPTALLLHRVPWRGSSPCLCPAQAGAVPRCSALPAQVRALPRARSAPTTGPHTNRGPARRAPGPRTPRTGAPCPLVPRQRHPHPRAESRLQLSASTAGASPAAAALQGTAATGAKCRGGTAQTCSKGLRQGLPWDSRQWSHTSKGQSTGFHWWTPSSGQKAVHRHRLGDNLPFSEASRALHLTIKASFFEIFLWPTKAFDISCRDIAARGSLPTSA